MIDLRHGDCLQVLRTMPDCSVDAIVTDPPYGLSFMNKRWDYDVPSVEVWAECLRVLKPGGHLLAFAGTRTQHRMAVRIEDAGFEIRDMIAWVYGSGFPKSLDVSKAIDKRGGVRAGFVEFRDAVKEAMKRKGVTRSQLCRQLGNFMCDHYLTYGSQPAIPSVHDYRIIRDAVGLGADWDHLFLDEAKREVIGQKLPGIYNPEDKHTRTIGASFSVVVNITAPATEAAQQWNGWGTALKPAMEPITVARKPIIGTVAENVLQHGTGALNIDGCRIGSSNGRWPANLIHDGSDEVLAGFPQTGASKASKRGADQNGNVHRTYGHNDTIRGHDDNVGSAARFFYCAKASKVDRDEGCEGLDNNSTFRTHCVRNHHPTVKPTDLMRYLCKLVTPTDGIVLDPFMGSGSTGKGAVLEGLSFIGIEREAEYIAIAKARINAVTTIFDIVHE